MESLLDDIRAVAGPRFASTLAWDHVSGCLEWTGYVSPKGYGRARRREHLGGSPFVHRMVWHVVNGPIEQGVQLDHLCGNRRCANPAHLERVTSRTNGRRRHGPNSNNRSSGIRGVSWHKGRGVWTASVYVGGKLIYLGKFDDVDEAERAAVAGRVRYHGVDDMSLVDRRRAAEIAVGGYPIFDECCRDHGRYDSFEDALAAWSIGQPAPFSDDNPDGSGER